MSGQKRCPEICVRGRLTPRSRHIPHILQTSVTPSKVSAASANTDRTTSASIDWMALYRSRIRSWPREEECSRASRDVRRVMAWRRNSGYLRAVWIETRSPSDAFEQLLTHLGGGDHALVSTTSWTTETYWNGSSPSRIFACLTRRFRGEVELRRRKGGGCLKRYFITDR